MSRVLVVGWDGATWSVAAPLAEAGRLPALASLRTGGAEGILRSVPNMNSAPAWSTVATGLNPGRHGIFYFDEPVPGTYRRRIVNAGRRSGETLWSMASRAGKRIVVVNVPISYPAEPVNGFLVAGLDTPSKSLPGFAHPQDLPQRHADLFERYVIEPGAKALMRAGRSSEAADLLMRSIDGWASVTERLMRDESWDLAFVVFTSSDTAQHFFWSGPKRDVVERVYELQDEATSRLVALARERDPFVNVLVIADHGGAANTRGPELMPIWLEDQGLQARANGSAAERARVAAFRLLDRTLTRERKLALARRFPRLRERAQSEARLAGIDWSGTRAYSDGVRDEVLVNVAGREPEGVVPEGDYAALVAELTGRISAIREVETDRPVVASATPRDRAYHGPFVSLAPDITIRWVTDGPFRGFACDTPAARRQMQEAIARPPFQPGGHHPDGLFVAHGPNIAPAPVAGRLEDLTPTVLSLLEVPVPAGLDGEPLPIVRGVTPEVSGESVPVQAPIGEAGGYTPQEEAEVRKRLEDLGYI
ncbi:MAG: alkaline phosphatase family protein [Actinomycetota bacterium]